MKLALKIIFAFSPVLCDKPMRQQKQYCCCLERKASVVVFVLNVFLLVRTT